MYGSPSAVCRPRSALRSSTDRLLSIPPSSAAAILYSASFLSRFHSFSRSFFLSSCFARSRLLSSFTTCYLRLTTHYLLLTAYCLLLTTDYADTLRLIIYRRTTKLPTQLLLITNGPRPNTRITDYLPCACNCPCVTHYFPSPHGRSDELKTDTTRRYRFRTHGQCHWGFAFCVHIGNAALCCQSHVGFPTRIV